jgi:hypothetical protein
MKHVIAVLFSLFASHFALAQEDLLTVKLDGISKAATPAQATRDVQASLMQKTAREQVIAVLGDKRYNKNKPLIESKIVRQSAKFIPFVNPGLPVQQPDGSFKVPVELKISLASLRKMVSEAGFLNDSEGPATIFPMVTFVDRSKALTTRWWMGLDRDDTHKFLNQTERTFYEKLQAELSGQGFHLIKPLETQASPLPEMYRVERPSQADAALLGEYYRASMILKGDVRFREARDAANTYIGSVKLQVVQSASGRMVAEVSREFTTDAGQFETVMRAKLNAELPDIAKDLAVQVLEAWQRGTINANLVRLAVRGTMNPKQLNEFKGALQRGVREMKGLKERSFERGQVVFEVDYAGDAASLAERLKTLQIPSFDTRLASSSEQGLTMDVKAH